MIFTLYDGLGTTAVATVETRGAFVPDIIVVGIGYFYRRITGPDPSKDWRFCAALLDTAYVTNDSGRGVYTRPLWQASHKPDSKGGA